MNQYTESLNIQAETLSPDDDNYEEKLRETASLFRGFDLALTAFIKKHGYCGDDNDIDAKVVFFREQSTVANVKLPRNFKEWFFPNATIKRPTAYKICFALGLNVDETNEFFKCVQFERSFDCHTICEAVFYFCIKNNLSYTEAQEIIKQIPIPTKTKVPPNREVLYTGVIINYINGIKNKTELIQYITDNINDFQYNNVTAITYIRELWNDISKNDGLATKEGRIIDRYNQFENRQKKGVTDTRSAEVIAEEVRYQEKNVKPTDFVVAADGSSTWTIFSQIIGLKNYLVNKYAEKKYDRRLTSVLTENALMPLNSSYCFPSQHNIERLLRGEMVADESVRKILIFLVFYSYWAKIIISKNDAFYSVKPSDSERCLANINNRLLGAGYQELYSGNPYDWLFLWSLNDDNPLQAFRYYMGEVFAVKEEDTEEDTEEDN